MLIRQAFKFELIPNGAQIRKMKQFCGCARFVFNRALAYQNMQYEADKSFKFSYTKIANLLPEWKKRTNVAQRLPQPSVATKSERLGKRV